MFIDFHNLARSKCKTHLELFFPLFLFLQETPKDGQQNQSQANRRAAVNPDPYGCSFAALPEETYCSALDINSQEGDPRFPWQRDAAVQCDLSPSGEGYKYDIQLNI